LAEPILDKLQEYRPTLHRRLNLAEESPIFEGEFAAGNGWQEVKFGEMVSGRYICIEMLNAHNGGDVASIAELELLGEDGTRLPREEWVAMYADSEERAHENRTADKVLDLQESTYWSSAEGVKFPHTIVIDMGGEQTISGLQYLPRMEQDAPGSIKRYRIYVKQNPFKF
jgi:beta-galactosidase